MIVSTNGVHLAITVPLRNETRDWRDFLDVSHLASVGWVPSHVEFGWGERDFFLSVPEWEDLTSGVALHALLVPSVTAMHVTYRWNPEYDEESSRRVRVGAERYAKLVSFLERSFRRDERGRPELIRGVRYHKYDQFYEGAGSYWFPYTCNTWAAEALAVAELPAPLWTPFDFPVFWHLPK